jgi:hypothetical protein
VEVFYFKYCFNKSANHDVKIFNTCLDLLLAF